MIPILRASDAGELKRRVMNRSQLQNEEVSRIVKEIVARIRQEGDAALFDYTAKFDHVTMTAETVLVTKDEIARAYEAASPEWLDAMREAARRITAFHEKQKQNTWLNFDPAISLGQKITPLKRVGVYVPGGTAAYPSSVLMNVLPAKVAGVKEIIMVTPPAGTARSATRLPLSRRIWRVWTKSTKSAARRPLPPLRSAQRASPAWTKSPGRATFSSPTRNGRFSGMSALTWSPGRAKCW